MVTIQLRNGKTVKLDDGDATLVSSYTWYECKDGSRPGFSTAIANMKLSDGKYHLVAMHRFILGLLENPAITVRHDDGDGLNNCRSNLLVMSPGYRRRTAKVRDGKSTPKGVSHVKHAAFRAKPYEARITIDGKRYFLGRYKTPEEAEAAYQRALAASSEVPELDRPMHDDNGYRPREEGRNSRPERVGTGGRVGHPRHPET